MENSYPYANGVIRAIEEHLLDQNTLIKLQDLEPNEFLRTLIDLGYGADAKVKDGLEVIIQKELLKTKKILNEITPKQNESDLFYVSYDTLNLKTLWKSKIFNIKQPLGLTPLGSIPVEALKKAVLEDDDSFLEKPFLELHHKVAKAVNGMDNARKVSYTIEQCVFDFAFDQLGRFPSALKTYLTTFLDFSNVITLVRSLNLKWSQEQFTEMFMKGGAIPLSVFLEAYVDSNEMARVFNPYYQEKISKILSKHLSFTALESNLNILLLEDMKRYEYDSFHIGPMMYYYLKKQAEASNIRLLFAKKKLDANELLTY